MRPATSTEFSQRAARVGFQVAFVADQVTTVWAPTGIALAALLVLGSMAITEVLFGEMLGPAFGRGPLHYVVFPFASVAAVRFGQPATALPARGGRCDRSSSVFRQSPSGTPRAAQVRSLARSSPGPDPVADVDAAGVELTLELPDTSPCCERLTGQRRRGAAHAVGDSRQRARVVCHVLQRRMDTGLHHALRPERRCQRITPARPPRDGVAGQLRIGQHLGYFRRSSRVRPSVGVTITYAVWAAEGWFTFERRPSCWSLVCACSQGGRSTLSCVQRTSAASSHQSRSFRMTGP